jgi:hypothetical protein
MVIASLACCVEADTPGVINDIALASLVGATANISSATAARPRTRPRLECAILVMFEVSWTQRNSKRSSHVPMAHFRRANLRSPQCRYVRNSDVNAA